MKNEINRNVPAGKIYTNTPETATLLGLVKQRSCFTPIQDLKEITDFV